MHFEVAKKFEKGKWLGIKKMGEHAVFQRVFEGFSVEGVSQCFRDLHRFSDKLGVVVSVRVSAKVFN